MRVVSTIKDGRINALNVLTEMSIDDYLSVGERILQKNEFQRNRVKRSSSVYSLLRKDLKENCTFPPIVLALSFDKVQSLYLGESLTDEKLLEIFKPEYLVILDGLQRTYNLKEVKDEFLKNGDMEKLEKYLNNKIRIEIYIGINKLGILYRMLTLNTGLSILAKLTPHSGDTDPLRGHPQIKVLFLSLLSFNDTAKLILFSSHRLSR